MGAVTIELSDLTPFAPGIDEAKAAEMIVDAIAMASAPWVAPCILNEDFQYAAQAKAILRGAILRWDEAGAGAVTQVSAGPFQQSIDNRTPRRRMFTPSEITDLQRLCGMNRQKAFTINTTPNPPREEE